MPNKEVTLQLGNYCPIIVEHVSQGDTDWTWVFQVVDDHGQIYAPEVRYAILAGNKPDGHAFAYLCTKDGDTYKLPPSAYDIQMTAAAGDVRAELRLLGSNGKGLGSCNFTIRVEEGPEGAVTVASDSSLPAYLTILNKIGTIPDDVSGYISDWLEDHISGGQGVAVDNTLTVQGAAADAKAAGDRLKALEEATIETDDTLTVQGAAADAKATGDEIKAIKDSLDPMRYVTKSGFTWQLGSFNNGADVTSTTRCRTTHIAVAAGDVLLQTDGSIYDSVANIYDTNYNWIRALNGGSWGHGPYLMPQDGYVRVLARKPNDSTISAEDMELIDADFSLRTKRIIPELDSCLSKSGYAADAKATGERILMLGSALVDLCEHVAYTDQSGALYVEAIRSLLAGQQLVKYLKTTDLLFGLGMNASANGYKSTPPYTGSVPYRACYPYFDLPAEGGCTYIVEFAASIDTAEINLQFFNERAVELMESHEEWSAQEYSTGWLGVGTHEIILPVNHRGSPFAGFRVNVRQSSNNENVTASAVDHIIIKKVLT